MTANFNDQLRRAARAIPTPEPPSNLIQRVLAERQLGARVALPIGKPAKGRLYRGWFGLAAAALIVASIPLARHVLTTPPDLPASPAGFLIGEAFTAQPRAERQLPPLRASPATTFPVGAHRYVIHMVDSIGRETPDGDGTIRISDAALGGQPAWRVEHLAHTVVDNQRRLEAETLFVAKRDLRLLSRVVEVRPYHRYSFIKVAQRFNQDTVSGEMTAEGGVRRTFTRHLPSEQGPYVSDALAPFLLAGTTLSVDWSASLSVIGWAVVPGDVFIPVSLRVIGEETIGTSAGRADCWKLAVDAGAEHRIEWVRKADGIAVRSFDRRVTPSGHRVFTLLPN